MSDAKFPFFLTLTLIAGAATYLYCMAIVFPLLSSHDDDTNKRRHFGVSILLLLAVLAVGSFGIARVGLLLQTSQEDPILIVFFMGCMLAPLVTILLVVNQCPVFVFWNKLVLTAACLLIPGLVLLAMYGRSVSSHHSDQNYLGPMRIVGVDSTNKFRTGIWTGQVKVAFGVEWACPAAALEDGQPDPLVWCEALVSDRRCDIVAWDMSEVRNTSIECIRKLYGLDRWNVSFEKQEEYEFDLDAPPQQDPTWPFATFFGNCASCTAMSEDEFQTISKHQDRLNLAGIVICSVALTGVLIAALVVDWDATVFDQEAEKEQDPPESSQTVDGVDSGEPGDLPPVV